MLVSRSRAFLLPPVALALLLASSPLVVPWAHLGAGRVLLRPGNPPVDGPLPGDGGRWLFDGLLAGAALALEPLAGGMGWLIFLRLALAVALALLVLRLARGAGDALAGAAATLVVVALAPWLAPTPTLASCLALAGFLASLEAFLGGQAAGAVRAPWWPLPAITLVWANLDSWAVLAPAVLGLTCAGEWLRGARPAARRLLPALAACAAAASLAAPGLSQVLAAGAGEGASPLLPAWFRSGATAVGVAHLLLLGLGVVALVLCPPARRWGPAWLGLLALSVARPEAAPFFAVGSALLASRGLGALTGFWGGLPALVSVAAGWACVLAAWPGWLQGGPAGRRAWGLEADGGLAEALGRVDGWRQAGDLPRGRRGLTLSPEVRGRAAWSDAPGGGAGLGETGGPPGLTPAMLATFRAALTGAGGEEWRDLARARRIDHVVAHLDGREEANQLFGHLAGQPAEWPLLYLRGRTAVFGWNDPARAGSGKAPPPLDLEARAFGSRSADRAPDLAPEGPAPPRPRAWWRAFLDRPASRPEGRDEAGLYLALFDARRPEHVQRLQAAWVAGAGAGVVAGAPGACGEPLPAVAEAAARLGGIPAFWPAFAFARDDGPAALPLLAARAARRALAEEPGDARTQFYLGEAYLRLAEATRERAWVRRLPVFGQIRQAQAVAAFNAALAGGAGGGQAHGRLARLHRGRGEVDLTLRHLDGLIAATRARGPRPGENAELFREGLAGLESERKDLAAEVARREELAGEKAATRRLIDLAQDASDKGLPGRALALLLGSDASEFGPEGTRLELDLLLWAGRAADAREWATPEIAGSVGPAFYHELHARLAAVVGDYPRAVRELEAVAEGLGRVRGRPAAELAAVAYSRALLRGAVADASPAALAESALARAGLEEELARLAARRAQQADVRVVVGLLALEAGALGPAREALRRALEAARDGADFPGRPVAEDALRRIGNPPPEAGGP